MMYYKQWDIWSSWKSWKKVDRNQLKNKIKEILDELTEDDLEEITTTAAAPGYMTPMAFKGKKKKKIKYVEGKG